jgi:hypothetical protein
MARFNLSENQRPERYIHSVFNVDTSGTQNADNHINVGTPLVLNLSQTGQPTTAGDGFAIGYQDGLQVELPSTGGQVCAAHFAYGVAMGNIATSSYGESMVHGVCKAVFEVVLTRTSTTSVWASYAAINTATGTAYAPLMLSIDTLNNAFATYTTLAANNLQPPAVLLDSIASFTTNASTIGVSSLTSYASTLLARVFVRMM